MTTLGGALRPTLNEGELGGAKEERRSIRIRFVSDFHDVLSPRIGLWLFFFHPHLSNHILPCTSYRRPCVDLSMLITLMFLSRLQFPQ